MSIFDRFTNSQIAFNDETRTNSSLTWGPSNNGKAYRQMFSENLFTKIDHGKLLIEAKKNQDSYIANIIYIYADFRSNDGVDLSNIKDIVINVSKVEVRKVFNMYVWMYQTNFDNNGSVNIKVTEPKEFKIPISIFAEEGFDVDLTKVARFGIIIDNFHIKDEIETGDYLVIDKLSSTSHNNFINRPLNNFINFGKYKGHTYRYVIRHDKDYCNWVLNTAKDKDSSAELREFARYIRN